MRFTLALVTNSLPALITLNYQYPLSAAIYKIIQRADEGYASFLHGTGYKYEGKSFKLFTFSDLRTPFTIRGDRLLMKTNAAELTVCFHIPDAAENFIKGLFMHQQLEIADSRSKVVFSVQQVYAESTAPVQQGNVEVMLQPMSPLVVGRRNERGHYNYLGPLDEGFAELLVTNLLHKYASICDKPTEEQQYIKSQIAITPVLFSQPPRQRLLTIKAGTKEETKVKGYDKFRLEMQAPAELVELALNSGVGQHNSIGFGCVLKV